MNVKIYFKRHSVRRDKIIKLGHILQHDLIKFYTNPKFVFYSQNYYTKTYCCSYCPFGGPVKLKQGQILINGIREKIAPIRRFLFQWYNPTFKSWMGSRDTPLKSSSIFLYSKLSNFLKFDVAVIETRHFKINNILLTKF